MEGTRTAPPTSASSSGFILEIGTAARDPLFFLLHGNVDRLWARGSGPQAASTRPARRPTACAPAAPGTRVGHNSTDTMWPWNGVTGAPRPSTAPGAASRPRRRRRRPEQRRPCVAMIDYQGLSPRANAVGFDYDDVPFEV